MGLVLYLFGAIVLVLLVGWAVYVLPVPGDMSAWEMGGAFVPALLILGGVLVCVLLLAAPFYVLRLIRSFWRSRAARQDKS